MPNPQPRPKKAEIPSREPVYVYHWGRIIGMIAVLALLTGAGGYALYAWLAPDIGQPPVTEPAAPSVAATASTKHSRTETGIERKPDEQAPQGAAPPPQAMPVTPVVEPATSREPPPEPETSAASDEPGGLATATSKELLTSGLPSAESEPAAPSAQPAAASADTHEIQPPAKQQGPDQGLPSPELASATQIAEETPPAEDQPQQAGGETTADKADTATSRGPFQLQELQILDPQVKRFVLPRAVINKEPKGEIDEIRLKPDGSAAVWCYSEVSGRRGSVLRYVWYHQGSRMARVRVNVRGNRWRSYSSKVVNLHYPGDWRVELQDGAGRVLASAEFTLRAE